ncbi:MBL fold metallo-hydrolase [Polluticaenibacter yanchengensis]|uniref:MBL fold metallo-hydrolase n=1 Tax=Polluticaenibacter yanchengensis TaxID=3014562 RepID=A0ABT4UKG4_9BACT|nr:MBL fold metallo-hydrolase [Chitinophagaceae bacterium LY-5]
MLEFTFLGTGTSSGVPMIGCKCEVCLSTDARDKRLRSSLLVRSATTTIVVDAGPDFRQQMLRENVDKLDAVLITHPHKDHIAGLDDTRAFQFLQGTETPVYGNAISLQGVRNEIPYAFRDFKYPGVPDIVLHEIDLTPFTIGDIYIEPILVMHHKMPVYGFKFGDFAYITDANFIDATEMEKIKGIKHLVLNALRLKDHISHYTLSQALSVMNDLQVENGYLTHISHQLGKTEDITKLLPTNVMLAYDGLKITV